MDFDLVDELRTFENVKETKLTFASPAKNLAVLAPGESAVISGYAHEAAEDQRLAEMGVTLGTNVTLVKSAPLGGPIQLAVRGYHLSISKRIAQTILVK